MPLGLEKVALMAASGGAEETYVPTKDHTVGGYSDSGYNFVNTEHWKFDINTVKAHGEINVDWQAKVVGNYCLHASTVPEQLQCWQQQQGAKFSQEMVAKQDIIFTLQGKQSAKVLVKGSLAMA